MAYARLSLEKASLVFAVIVVALFLTRAPVHPYGVLLLTKLPLRRIALHSLQSKMGRKLLVAELSLSDATMAISTVHLESMEPNTKKRCQQLLYIMDELLAQVRSTRVARVCVRATHDASSMTTPW